MNLFSKEHYAGVFHGFTQGGLEFHADIVLPYQQQYHSVPMHGQFVLVQLENQSEAALGRITSLSSDGKLASDVGEDFTIRSTRDDGNVSDDLKGAFLKYRVNLRMLGVVRVKGNTLEFVASHRRLPHLGSRVAFPSPEILKALASDPEGALIGHFALGEYVYAGADQPVRDGLQMKDPAVPVQFSIKNLIARRSFIFARAGFGKSNLNKLLFSELYRETPKTPSRDVPVGTIIFDPDGEYFWPDVNDRPGLCDVPHLQDKLVVFTERKSKSDFYQSFVAGGIKLDIRRFRPGDVISIALSPDRQDQQNVRKLRGLSPERWEGMVDLMDSHGNSAPLETVCAFMDLDPVKQEAEALAARANMTTIVRTLHDKSSQLMDLLFAALKKGKLCVIDISQMRGAQSLVLSGLILKRIFDRNQEEFTKYPPETIPVIAVVEEAQSVLSEGATSAEPYITWVKEGRKYDLGALLITQQPGSIPLEILSQGDNWFVFHLLSSADLTNVSRANAHFSSDILSSLLNEPIPGHGVFWSSANRKSYPLPVRIKLFEEQYKVRDLKRNGAAIDTYATALKKEFGDLDPGEAKPDNEPAKTVPQLVRDDFGEIQTISIPVPLAAEAPPEEKKRDVKSDYEAAAIGKLRESVHVKNLQAGQEIAWGTLKAFLVEALPAALDDRETLAYHLVRKGMDKIFGSQNEGWHSFRDARGVTKVKTGRKPGST